RFRNDRRSQRSKIEKRRTNRHSGTVGSSGFGVHAGAVGHLPSPPLAACTGCTGHRARCATHGGLWWADAMRKPVPDRPIVMTIARHIPVVAGLAYGRSVP